MGDALFWGIAGLLISTAFFPGSIPMAVLITVITSIIGSLGVRIGEILTGGAAVGALAVFAMRIHLSVVEIVVFMSPLVTMTGLLTWWMATNRARSRRMAAFYAEAARKYRSRGRVVAVPATVPAIPEPYSGPREVHYHFHEAPRPIMTPIGRYQQPPDWDALLGEIQEAEIVELVIGEPEPLPLGP